MLLVLVQIIYKLSDFVERKTDGIEGEDSAEVHVVDIGPHGFQRNVGDGVLAQQISVTAV